MTKTNLQIINFINFARVHMKEHEAQTKFRYALERMEKRAVKLHETFLEDQRDINIENAATDKDGAILVDDKGNFRFTKDGIRKRDKGQKELLEKQIQIEPYLATEVPENLSQAEKDACSGFVLKEEVTETEL